jgi:hypothetical protein
MNYLRHTITTLTLLGICLLSTSNVLAQNSPQLQPFTAKYQLNRGDMLIGKVTNTLRLESDGSYTYTSVTKPVGIVAAFSSDVITEISKGRITPNQVTPHAYAYEHKRKKRPKLRKQQFNWSKNKLSIVEPKPSKILDISNNTQDKASMILSIMQAMSSQLSAIKIKVADKNKLKEYLISKQGKEQIKAGGSDYNSVKLGLSKSGQKPTTTLWLAPELNYLPVQIEKQEKKKSYTMILLEYTPGQPAAAKK